jgi:hypothetical protein
MVSTDATIRSPREPRPENYQLVELDEFCDLLLGFTHLERADDPANGMRGLYDEATGITYLIEREKLARHAAHRPK